MSRLGLLGGTTGRAGADARSCRRGRRGSRLLRVAPQCGHRADREPRRRLSPDGASLLDLRGRCRGRLSARPRDPAHQGAADRGRRAGPLDADGDQAGGAGGAPPARATPRVSTSIADPDEDVDRDPLESIASESPGPNDRAARRERVARSGEALQALKPQEVRALTLKAQGYSYAEIGEITGWSYTKINRCMAEGRKRFLQVFADIEQGRRCEELAGALSEMADGEGANGSTEALQFHLRSCATCRAKLRAYRAIPGTVFELMPAGPLLDQSMGGGPHEWIAERAARRWWTRFARRAIRSCAARRWRWQRRCGRSCGSRGIARRWHGGSGEGARDLRGDGGRRRDLRCDRRRGYRFRRRRLWGQQSAPGETGPADYCDDCSARTRCDSRYPISTSRHQRIPPARRRNRHRSSRRRASSVSRRLRAPPPGRAAVAANSADRQVVVVRAAAASPVADSGSRNEIGSGEGCCDRSLREADDSSGGGDR